MMGAGGAGDDEDEEIEGDDEEEDEDEDGGDYGDENALDEAANEHQRRLEKQMKGERSGDIGSPPSMIHHKHQESSQFAEDDTILNNGQNHNN
jgi:hypothetical protein